MYHPDYQKLATKFKSKLLPIKVALFDVDGVLTDGRVYYDGEEVGFNRFFNVRDGYGMNVLREAGIKVGIITGGNSLGVLKRFRENLKVDFLYYGNEDKRQAYKDVLSQGYSDNEILYIGDEFFDLPLLKRAGFSASPPTASPEILEAVDYVTMARPGMGVVREVIDILRKARDIVPQVADF